jgi:hypothetical protein
MVGDPSMAWHVLYGLNRTMPCHAMPCHGLLQPGSGAVRLLGVAWPHLNNIRPGIYVGIRGVFFRNFAP